MTTIATDILRDYEAEIAHCPDADTRAAAERAPQRILNRLCEAAKGIRIGYHEWVFPDGSELIT